jgi:FlaA1/EpsC-like NDP-sugar epimerase
MSSGALSSKYLSANSSVVGRSFVSAADTLRKRLAGQVTCTPAITILMAEVAIAGAAFLLTLFLFREALGVHEMLDAMIVFLAPVLVLRGAALAFFGVFRRSLRYASVADVIPIAGCAAASSLGWYAIYRVWDFGFVLPVGFFLVDALTFFASLAAFHFSVRSYHSIYCMVVGKAPNAKRVIIVGAGDAGATVLNELVKDSHENIHPVALIDDDPTKKEMRICGVPVIGAVADLSKTVVRLDASEVLVCIPSATDAQMQHILTACRECGVPVRTLPDVSELVRGHVSSRDLRPVRIEDILPRKQAAMDRSLSQALVKGKVVLVTGAGGSIGSELSRQLAAAGPERLILFDKSENNLFHSHMAVQQAWPAIDVKPVLGDILDEHLLSELFTRERPNLVFHAAAFKHVGMMELHPYQAIKNNVLGTWRLLSAALASGVERFVNVSTDKAVNPCNYMGLSKKLAERLVREAAVLHGVRYVSVRFGNVAGSSGSVLQLFFDQIGKGGPLRVTDPRASRYFMSITEAAYLTMCAARLGRGGETFILDMGDPINIYELARTLSLFSGLAPEEELPIEFIGLREGEKIHEELWETWEKPRPTGHPQIFALEGSDPFPIHICSAIDKLAELVDAHDHDGVLALIDELAPEFAAERTSKAPISIPIRREMALQEGRI